MQFCRLAKNGTLSVNIQVAVCPQARFGLPKLPARVFASGRSPADDIRDAGRNDERHAEDQQTA